MTAFLLAVTGRELRIAWRHRGATGANLVFFAIVTTFFPLGLGTSPALLASVAPAALWIAALMAVLLTSDRLFVADHEAGVLEQVALSAMPLELFCLGKILAHWLSTALPLAVLAPLLSIALGVAPEDSLASAAAILAGMAGVCSLCAIGAALALGLSRTPLLAFLNVAPFSLPFLIFGAEAIRAGIGGLPVLPWLFILLALSLFFLGLAPVAAAAALRLSLS